MTGSGTGDIDRTPPILVRRPFVFAGWRETPKRCRSLIRRSDAGGPEQFITYTVGVARASGIEVTGGLPEQFLADQQQGGREDHDPDRTLKDLPAHPGVGEVARRVAEKGRNDAKED